MLPQKDIIFVRYPAILALGVMKGQTRLPSLHRMCRIPRLLYPILILNIVSTTCQDDWNGAVANKLHSVKPIKGDRQFSYRRCRKDEVVLCRARTGHTHLTHSYIIKKDPPPLCEHCQCIQTVCHILVECNHFAQERKYIFGRRDVVESFHPTLILLFLKRIEFYHKF